MKKWFHSKWLRIILGCITLGLGYWVFFSGEQEQPLPDAIRENWTVFAGTLFTDEPLLADVVPPEMSYIEIPDFAGAFAIWGAIGRAKDGIIWFSVAAHGAEVQSARLFAYHPKTQKVTQHSDVLTELSRLGLLRDGEQQVKIHTKILQGADGYLYFASTDDPAKDRTTESTPIWGSHLWRY